MGDTNQELVQEATVLANALRQAIASAKTTTPEMHTARLRAAAFIERVVAPDSAYRKELERLQATNPGFNGYELVLALLEAVKADLAGGRIKVVGGDATMIKARNELTRDALAVLNEKKVAGDCPRCKAKQWSADTFGTVTSPLPPEGFKVPPPSIPVMVLVCGNCGWIGMHSLKVLGVVS